VDNGNFNVGNKTQPPNSSKPIVEGLARTCGAMSQQRGDSGRGNYSVPQEFLQLVGCRESKARLEREVRPHQIEQ
jgi:hypothetical protein